MDPISNNRQRKHLSYKDILAQPLELRESLKIRDGLRESNSSLDSYTQSRPIWWTTPHFAHFWISNN